MPRIFLLIGQSNMVGAARAADLEHADRILPTNIRLYGDDDFRPVLWKERFGPEVGFSQRLGETLPETDDIVLCKVARGGTNLYYDWAPDRTEGGPEDEYRGSLYARLTKAMDELTNRLEGAEFSGALWAQGARDSVFEFMADAYEANLEAFITRLRLDTQTPDLPFLIAQTAPRSIDPETGGPRHPYRDTVKEAQRKIAERTPNASLVLASDIPQFDALHFDARGQLELGRRFADAWHQLTQN
jgi:hypothetical protein